MKRYTQLTQEQRYQISVLMKAGHTQADIADLLGVHKSTISRELRRNSGLKGYRPQQAHRFCLQRRSQKAAPRIAPFIWALVDVKNGVLSRSAAGCYPSVGHLRFPDFSHFRG